ncbi:MAG TPA: YgcG family protein [Caulobacteraceae bacterium]|nr:YgcG family protein [Caulobacteraceae bacterium]
MLIGLMLALFALPAIAAPTFPALTGRVVDNAHVLSAQTQADLTAKLADLETKTGRQVVVVTLPDLQGYDIEDYGYQLGRAWGIGQKGQNNGVLFIVVPSEHKVRIEVGYGLEPVLTDALSSVILQEQVLPKFRTGDVDGGVSAGTNAIISQLSLDQASAEANVARATQQAQPHRGIPIAAIFALFIMFIVFTSIFRNHGGGGLGWLLPLMILNSGSRSSWGGGGGGGFGGGGFSGGGGSFGGGGASGSW